MDNSTELPAHIERFLIPNKLHWLHHPKLGAKVEVRHPKWLPKWLGFLFDKNIGKEGLVVGVDRGKYTGEPIYLIFFHDQHDIKDATGAYFREDLVFTAPGIFEKR